MSYSLGLTILLPHPFQAHVIAFFTFVPKWMGNALGQEPLYRASFPRPQKGSNQCLFHSENGCHLPRTYWEPDTAWQPWSHFSDLPILKPTTPGLAKSRHSVLFTVSIGTMIPNHKNCKSYYHLDLTDGKAGDLPTHRFKA